MPSLDLFIEIQGNWTHGKHPYDESCQEDLKKKVLWESNAKASKYYANALEVWTKTDVMKRNKAREGHLNYFEYFGNDLEGFKVGFRAFISEV